MGAEPKRWPKPVIRESTCHCRSSGSISGAERSKPPGSTSRPAILTVIAVPFPDASTARHGRRVPSAQVLMSMYTESGEACAYRPAQCAATCDGPLSAEKGLTPVTAFELEFYLVDPAVFQRSGRMGKDQGAWSGPAADVFAFRIARTERTVRRDPRLRPIDQGLPIDTIIKEAAPGQFEVNLKHRDDAMAAADDTVLLRRLITECAHKHGLRATFMAKPFLEWPGNGMHVHASILDDQGRQYVCG
jgi:glutamine synthetase